ncbi:MAG: molybdate ABC transporter substrate-binding protein [Chloroflexi bacterium]|nr:molybdate ABC transporter substrate-binding protein [Chloroflexota bacterium]
MNFMCHKGRGFLFAALLLLPLAACSSAPTTASQASDNEAITVGAAADLQMAFAEIGELFRQETGTKVVFTFGSTGVLTQQIENGAPIDVFAAADVRYVDKLKDENLILADTQRIYAIGRLVLATNRATGLELRSLEDLTRPEVKRIAIANPAHAPYGAAAKKALEETGLWDQVSSRLVIGENISQAMQFVKTGNADAGLIALSVANTPEIAYTLIPEDKYSPIRQAMAVMKSSKNQDVARQFTKFVSSPKAGIVLRKYGFDVPENK